MHANVLPIHPLAPCIHCLLLVNNIKRKSRIFHLHIALHSHACKSGSGKYTAELVILKLCQSAILRRAAGYVMLQANVFVVGDPDQAIYGWRGANVINMQESFNNDYPGSCFGPLTLNNCSAF